MPGLFINNKSFVGGKYLVLRRDGTIPTWPHFVLGARDAAAPAALRAYAAEAKHLGFDPMYVEDVLLLAYEFSEFRMENGDGDPDAPRHRQDLPLIVAAMALSKGA